MWVTCPSAFWPHLPLFTLLSQSHSSDLFPASLTSQAGSHYRAFLLAVPSARNTLLSRTSSGNSVTLLRYLLKYYLNGDTSQNALSRIIYPTFWNTIYPIILNFFFILTSIWNDIIYSFIYYLLPPINVRIMKALRTLDILRMSSHILI